MMETKVCKMGIGWRQKQLENADVKSMQTQEKEKRWTC
jgi:hypothetical protein